MGGDVREQVAVRYDATARKLKRAAQHLRTAARHHRDREVPRGRAYALHGHIRTATIQMDDNAVIHAVRVST